MKRKITVCIVGGNYGLKVLLPAILRIKNITLKAIATKNKRIDKDIAYYNSWKKMIDECGPDLVLIAVPPKLQSNIIKYLIKNNINFLAEKPLTYNFIDAKKILDKFKKKKINAVVDLNFLKIYSILKYKKLIKKYKYLNSDIKIKWLFKSNSLKEKKSWKNKHKDGGGLYLNFGFHLVSLIIFLFGDIKFLKRCNKKNDVHYLLGKTKDGNNIQIKLSNNYVGKNIFSIRYKVKKNKYLVLENKSVNYHGNYVIYYQGSIKKNIIFKQKFQNSEESRINCSKLIITDLIKMFKKNFFIPFNNLQHSVRVHQIISNI